MFILPLEGENPTRHKHVVLWFIVATCSVVFAATLFTGRAAAFAQWGYVPSSSGLQDVLTSIALHANPWHLIGNMFFLWMFGDNIEDVIGHLLFLACFLVTGVVGAFTYGILHPESTLPLIGASGAVSGIAGMYLLFFPKVPAEIVFLFFRWEVHALKTTTAVAVGSWFALQFVLAILIEGTPMRNVMPVAFSAHVAGFLAGAILAAFFCQLGYVRRYLHKGKKHWLLGYVS